MIARRMAVAALAAALVLAPRAARAEPTPLARALTGQAADDYRAGRTLYEDGDYAGAAHEFASALERSGDARLYWNLAACAKGERRYAAALALLEKYRADTSGVVSTTDRREADAFAAAMQPFVVDVRFEVSEPGAEVAIDGEPVGASPLAPRRVDVGTRRFRVTKAGFRPFEEVVRLGVTPSWTLHAKLEPRAASLRVHARPPDAASIVVDGVARGVGAADVAVAPGVHVVRVEAPGMRPFEAQVPVDDASERRLDLTLDPVDAAPTRARVVVDVGCGDGRPVGPGDGLRLYVDGAAEKPVADAAAPVAYPIDAGRHTVRAYVPGCASLEAPVTVAGPSARFEGILPRSDLFLFRGPAGSPDGPRLGAHFAAHSVRAMVSGVEYFGPLDGAGIELAWVRRFWMAAFDLDTSRGTFAPQSTSSTTTLSASHTFGAVRFGLRLPLNVAALSAGVGLDVGSSSTDSGSAGSFGAQAWSSLDLAPFCDLVVPATAFVSSGDANVVFQVGLAYQPNARCRDERSLVFGVRGK